jgi:G:T-mismatch repair DNA endonuclease (very short patch repair protein)
VIVHRTKRLPTEQIVTLQGIPATTIERTLLDLCGTLTKRRAAIALDNALMRGLTTLGAIDHCLFLTARRGRNGCGVLRDLMKARLGLNTAPNSPLETVIHEMLFDSSLPTPMLQHVIRDERGAFVARPDFVYPTERLVIEGHSKLWHWGQLAESEDLEKHNSLSRLGFRILYVTWQDATTHRDRTVAAIARLLQAAA